MNLFSTVLFALTLGVGLYFTSEGLITLRNSYICEVEKYVVERQGDTVQIVQYANAESRFHCLESRRVVVEKNRYEVSDRSIEMAIKEYNNTIKIQYLCDFDSELKFLDVTVAEKKQQVWLGVALIFIGCIPLMF